MGIANAYACDGPKCKELTTRETNERKPSHWVQLTVTDPANGEKKSGAFHDATCAHNWVTEHVGPVTIAQEPKP